MRLAALESDADWVVISPRLGTVHEEAVMDAVFQLLERYPGGHIMAEQWRHGQTLKVIRREPYATASAKILPLHVLQKR